MLPLTLFTLPGLQGVHVCKPVVPANVPAKHASHDDSPFCACAVSIAHGKHCSKPVVLANEPGEHGAQDGRCTTLFAVPFGQGKQLVWAGRL